MDNQNQQMHKAPSGAMFIMLAGGVSFVNAIASYIFGLQYVNYGLYGFAAMLLHVIQAFALLGLAVHLLNKSSGILALSINAVVSVASIAFVFFLRDSSSEAAFAMMEYDHWLNLAEVFSYGTGTSILYIVLLVSFIINTILVKLKKEGRKLLDVQIVSVIQLLASFWSFFSEDFLGIQFAHIATYVILTLGLYMCAVHKAKGKLSVATAPLSKKSVVRIAAIMVIATLITIPISLALNDTSSKPIQVTEKECEFCEREFTDSKNKKYITKTNMCKNCYINFCDMTGKEPKNYD